MSSESRRGFVCTVVVGLWQAASARARQQNQTTPLRNSATAKTPAFLNPLQRGVLVRLMDRMIPADERSAGAVGAKVDEYVDFILLHADPALQRAWRDGLDSYGIAIAAKDGAGIDDFLTQQARREFSPATESERFFVYLKVAVTEGFYTSEEGVSRELGYLGMTFDMDPTGCTHAAHTVPTGYKPLLRAPETA